LVLDTGLLAGVETAEEALLVVVVAAELVEDAEVFTGVLAGVLTAEEEDEDEVELFTGVLAAEEAAEVLVDLVLGMYLETDFLVEEALLLVAGAEETVEVFTGAEETAEVFTEEEAAEVLEALETLLLLVGG
jgi:hypothetical protein